MTESTTPRNLIHEAAEFLVLAELLRRGIETYKAYSGYPGYDVLAVRAERACKIQVKSRAAIDFDHLFDLKGDVAGACHFVVLVALDRERLGKVAIDDPGQPRYWVVPAGVAGERRRGGARPRLKYDDVGEFADAWHLIVGFFQGVDAA